jgi:hypothetical protein
MTLASKCKDTAYSVYGRSTRFHLQLRLHIAPVSLCFASAFLHFSAKWLDASATVAQ